MKTTKFFVTVKDGSAAIGYRLSLNLVSLQFTLVAMNNFQNILKLSTPERLLLLEQFWNSIPSNEIAMKDSHKKELDKRLLRMNRGETKFFTWDEVKKNLRNK
jgi:putative addiction module component (TIGR02574 family)